MRVKAALVAFGMALLAGAGTAYADGAPVAGVSVGGGGVTWGALRYVALPAPKGTAVAARDIGKPAMRSSGSALSTMAPGTSRSLRRSYARTAYRWMSRGEVSWIRYMVDPSGEMASK